MALPVLRLGDELADDPARYPHWFVAPPPPHVCGAVQLPHSSTTPQRLLICPHRAPSSAHVARHRAASPRASERLKSKHGHPRGFNVVVVARGYGVRGAPASALWAAGEVSEPAHRPLLAARATDADPMVRRNAIIALGKLGEHPGVVELMVGLLQGSSPPLSW